MTRAKKYYEEKCLKAMNFYESRVTNMSEVRQIFFPQLNYILGEIIFKTLYIYKFQPDQSMSDVFDEMIFRLNENLLLDEDEEAEQASNF